MEFILLGAIKWYWQVLAVVLVVVCILLILIVLIQKGRGSGLSAAFSGAGGESAFGSKTGDKLTWVTICVVAAYLLLTMCLTKYFKPAIESDNLAGLTISSGPSGGRNQEVIPDNVPMDTSGPDTETSDLPSIALDSGPSDASAGGVDTDNSGTNPGGTAPEE